MKTSPVTRRTFLKTTAFAAGSYTILSRGIALAAPGSGSGSESISTKTFTKYRLICTHHPEVRVGQIAWLEASNLSQISKGIPQAVKVQATGPTREEATFDKLVIIAAWTSTIAGTIFVQKSVHRRLRMGGIAYDGRWIKPGEQPPSMDTKTYLDSPTDLPLTMPELSFDLADCQVDASVVKAGYFIGSLAVTGGQSIQNDTTYTTSDGKKATTESGAEGHLGLPDISTGGAISPKSISGKTEIKNKSGFSIQTTGTSTTTKEYSVKTGEDGKSYFTFDGTCNSSMSASIAIDWSIILQTKTQPSQRKA